MPADWVFYLGAGLLTLAGAWLGWWSLFGDRSRGRPRCGKCWYSMAGIDARAGAVCPECGWRARRASSLLKNRRRWWGIVAGCVVLLAGGAAALTPKVGREGVWSVVPDWGLLLVARTGHSPHGALAREYYERWGGDRWHEIASSVYRWNPGVRLTRTSWVEGVPLRVNLRREFVNAGQFKKLMFFLMDTRASNDADVVVKQSHEDWWQPDSVTLSRPLTEGNHIILNILPLCYISREPLCESPYTESFMAKVELRKSLDLVMTPKVLKQDVLFRLLEPAAFVMTGTQNLALTVNDVETKDVGQGVAIGALVEVVRDGRVLARGRWYQQAGMKSMKWRPVLIRFGEYPANRADNGPMPTTLDDLIAQNCTVRFSTDTEMALSAFECDKYWKGSFEVPLKDLVKR